MGISSPRLWLRRELKIISILIDIMVLKNLHLKHRINFYLKMMLKPSWKYTVIDWEILKDRSIRFIHILVENLSRESPSMRISNLLIKKISPSTCSRNMKAIFLQYPKAKVKDTTLRIRLRKKHKEKNMEKRLKINTLLKE